MLMLSGILASIFLNHPGTYATNILLLRLFFYAELPQQFFRDWNFEIPFKIVALLLNIQQAMPACTQYIHTP